ncbi:MAG: InlB B-repeat-containing protein [Clostridia bacterium]|nr:InlB B-repeat-containing protein [Clostridia bacterium]
MNKIKQWIFAVVACTVLALSGCAFPNGFLKGDGEFSESSKVASEGSFQEESSPVGEREEAESSSEATVGYTYKVTFKQLNQPDVVKTVKEGNILEDIPNPAPRTGYTVVWEQVDLTAIDKDIEVNSIETANTYEIKYDAAGGEVLTKKQEVVFDTVVDLALPTREGYAFVGWTNQGNAVMSGKWTIADNVTLVAVWQKKIVKRVTITFSQTGYEDIVKELDQGATLAEADVPKPQAKTGYTVSWSQTEFFNVQENVKVQAVAVPNDYTITYDANGGSVKRETQTVTFDKTPEAFVVPERNGYEFVSWQYAGVTVLPSDAWTIADNVTLVAQWREIVIEKVYITFSQTGYDDIVKELDKGGSLDESDIPEPQEKVGYTVKWSQTEFVNVQESIGVQAVALPNDYKITYDANGGSVGTATQIVKFDKAPETFAIPEREGFEFICWQYEGVAVLPSDPWAIAKDVTLVANWREIIVNKYTVTFRQAGQIDKVFEEIKEGTAFTNVPEPAKKTGYTVVWDEEKLALLENVQENIIIEAVETVKTYTIVLDAKGGTLAQTTITVAYGETYYLPIPTYKDHEFIRWKYNGKTLAQRGVWLFDEENIIVTAVWYSEWGGQY